VRVVEFLIAKAVVLIVAAFVLGFVRGLTD